ncbi:electron transfer flavoprotein subunit beta [Paenibacillus sp. LMG 31460]|uniref:Electron transfer flavoprotein subunit beta n=1 Tax=Paenibacillus germinis TaxID=2654979 RepID=A0ABX1ZAR6_9BACL|nr:electron transfer flavoprotein subunit beta/FixA family protein [Paenibacillus germinis]NOU89346.1 electron transfer flavoprotein subunit beta [Paenibacillus germinis]
MNIVVILKQTLDTEEKITISNGLVQSEGLNHIINPYDEYAVEEGLQLKEKFGGEVTVITLGPSGAESAVRTALAMGADKGILVDDESLSGDEHTISKVISSIIKHVSFDIVLAGNTSVDNGAGQVGIRLAEELGIPHISSVTKLTVEGHLATVVRDVEGDTEIIETSLPVLITAQQGLNEPRYPSLPGIMKAKKKPIEKVNANQLGLHPDDMKAKTTIIDQFLPKPKDAGRILAGNLQDQAKELVKLLHQEAKVI